MKKVVVAILGVCMSMTSCSSCDKKEVNPDMMKITYYGKRTPYGISYWSVGGQQKKDATSQTTVVEFPYDKDYANLQNQITSYAQAEDDSIYMKMEYQGKSASIGLKIKAGQYTRTIGLNSNSLK